MRGEPAQVQVRDAEQGLDPTSRLFDIGDTGADDRLAALLAVAPGAGGLRVERLRPASGEPMAIETTYLSQQRFPGLRRRLATTHTSLYTALSEI